MDVASGTDRHLDINFYLDHPLFPYFLEKRGFRTFFDDPLHSLVGGR